MTPTAEREQRVTQAADWFFRLRDPGITPGEIDEWLGWCEVAPENKEAFTEMQSLWKKTGGLDELALPAHASQPKVTLRSATQRARFDLTKWPLRAVAAAVLGTVITIGVAWFVNDYESLTSRDVIISTTTGVNRSVVLPDGSTVTIAADSRLATRYTAERRNVFLERGEAYFQVKKNTGRPFVVHALDATVTAVGTAFNVRAEEGMVRVAVTEGAVDVDHSDSHGLDVPVSRKENIRLAAGSQVTLSPIAIEPIVVSVDANQATSWMSGTLQFSDEPLASVVTAVNRYSPTPITLANRDIGAYRYTGTVAADRVDEWLRGLQDIFPVSVDKRNTENIRIEDSPRTH